MTRFIIRRLLASIPVMLGIVAFVFILARVIPGDPCVATYGEKATPEICAAFNSRYGLDLPIVPFIVKAGEGWALTPDLASVTNNQFLTYLGALLQGDLGSSIRFGRPVTDLLVERLPVTIELTLFALTFATVVGVTLGLISALRRNSPVDVATMIVANLGVSTPVFVLGLVLQIIFAVWLKDTFFTFPPSGRLTAGTDVVPIAVAWGLQDLGGPLRGLLDFVSNINTVNAVLTLNGSLFLDAVGHLVLPAVAVGTIPLAIIARMTRSSLLEVLGLDYIRTARAKGLRERFVIVRHGMRNAMLPVVTVVGLSVAGFLSGAVLTETVFNLAGVGRTLYDAITGRDYIVIQGFTIVVALGYVIINLVVDVSYAILDPRIRLG
jgi:peptide/nickel transport system permease protein